MTTTFETVAVPDCGGFEIRLTVVRADDGTASHVILHKATIDSPAYPLGSHNLTLDPETLPALLEALSAIAGLLRQNP